MNTNLKPATLASSSSSSLADNKNRKFLSCMPGTPSRWFFSGEKLKANNPSLCAGIDLEKELFYRQQAASFIHDLGTKLHLPHWIMNVAIVYMHRFYVYHSFRRFPRNDLSAAALFLAAKVEEMPRKLEHIVKLSYALQHRDEPQLDMASEKYMEEAQRVATFENVLLQTLGFDLNVEVPNTFVVKRIQLLNAPKSLAFAAYHFTTDSLHLTTLCLRYRPSVVACACIYLACDWAKWEMPALHDGKPWYSYFDAEVTPEILKALSDELVNVYQRCPDRLRNKRHIASIKRDSNGSIIASSIMMDRNNGVSLAELHDGLSSSDYFPSASSSSVPAIANVSISSATCGGKVKDETEAAIGKQNSIGNVDGNGKATVHPNRSASATSALHTRSEMPSTTFESLKKQRSETSKVDLKLYKERMKERELERPRNVVEIGQLAPVRKSFIPDMSTTTTDSWLFSNNSANEEKSKEAKESRTEKSVAETNSNSNPKLNSGHRGDRQSSSQHERHHNNHHHHGKHRHNEKKASSSEVVISLKDRHRYRPETPVEETSSPSPSLHRHRSQREHQTSSESLLEINHHSTNNDQSISKKRPHNDGGGSFENEKFEQRDEKIAKIIDYEHGIKNTIVAKNVTDYEHGVSKIVTDYDHGAMAPQMRYVKNNEFGLSETKSFTPFSAKEEVSLTSTTTVFNELKSEEETRIDTNGKSYSSIGCGKIDLSDKGGLDGCAKPTKIEKAQFAGGAQAVATDRHFQHLRKAFIPKPELSSSMSTDCSTTSNNNLAGVSSIVGSRLPGDDILRQATQKAEQMQKLERLEKLKNTKFTDLPIVATIKLQFGGLSKLP